jgi:hypothetical protein
MEKLMKEMLDEKVWAVVGASNNKDKFGYKVFKRLLAEGYDVYPVNPNCEEVDGMKCYKSLSELPKLPGAVSLIVPPSIGVKVLEDASKLGIKKLWFQPGAESDEIVQKASELGLDIVYDNCVLVALG